MLAYECHLMGDDIVGEVWGGSKERVKITIDNYKARQTYYGALNLFELELIVEAYPTGDGECTVNFVKGLQSINIGKKYYYFGTEFLII